MAEYEHVKRLDFSQFHPLDHWPFEHRCGQFYGGGFHHLKIAWQYRRKEQLIHWIWKTLRLCRPLGHQWVVFHQRDRGFFATCFPCGARREATSEEVKRFGRVPIFDENTEVIGRKEEDIDGDV